MSEYSQLVTSDVERDGLGLELWNGEELIAEIFRSDRERQMQITLWKQDVPLDLIEQLIADAKTRLLPSQVD